MSTKTFTHYEEPPKNLSYHMIDPKDLSGENSKAYNPTIFMRDKRIFMVYRTEEGTNTHTNLSRVELDPDTYKPISRPAIMSVVRSSGRVTTIDDPRFFRHRNKHMLAVNQGTHLPDWKWATSMTITDLSGPTLQSTMVMTPRYGNNINYIQSGRTDEIFTEKNWTFVRSWENDMLFAYTLTPFELIRIPQNNEVKFHSKVGWENPWKRFLGGGTSFEDFDDDTLICMFHSHQMDEKDRRNYDAGWLLVDKQSLKPTFISKKPVAWGWEDVVKDIRYSLEPNSGWRPLCFYPCGLLVGRKEIIVSAGWNDCRCMICYFSREDITKTLVKISA